MENTTAEKPPVENAPESPAPAKKKFKLKRYQKVLLILLIILVVLLVALDVIVSVIATSSVRAIAPMITGTKVEVKAVTVGVLRGRLEVYGFKVGNPEGFSEKNALELNKLIFEIVPSSVLSDKIRIQELRIDGVAVSYEPSLSLKSNIGVIESNINKFTSRLGGDPNKKDDKRKVKKDILVKVLSTKDISVSVATLPATPLPNIEINNVGEGKPIGEMITSFFQELLISIGKLGGDAGKLVGDTASAAAAAAGKQLGNAASAASDAASSAGKSVSDAASGLTDSVKGLWKKSDEK